MNIGRRFDVELAQSWQRDIGDGHVSTQSCSHQSRSLTYYTATQYQYAGRTNAWHAANQLSLAAFGLLQVISAIQCSHSSSHLTHRLQ